MLSSCHSFLHARTATSEIPSITLPEIQIIYLSIINSTHYSFACHFTNATAQIVQGARFVNYW